jgi:hypothetical protein
LALAEQVLQDKQLVAKTVILAVRVEILLLALISLLMEAVAAIELSRMVVDAAVLVEGQEARGLLALALALMAAYLLVVYILALHIAPLPRNEIIRAAVVRVVAVLDMMAQTLNGAERQAVFLILLVLLFPKAVVLFLVELLEAQVAE